MYTNTFSIKIFYILPTDFIYVIFLDLKTAIVFLRNINRLVFVIKTERVYYAVRSVPLNIIKVNFRKELNSYSF